MPPPATVTNNDCDRLAEMGVLCSPAGAPARQPPSAAPATPVSATPAGATSKLAEDGATVCKLKPALVEELRDEALMFVRYDKTAGRIVMSEKVAGKRQPLSLNADEFARRAMSAANDIPAGGLRCGVAFWDGEAIKAATAAMN